MEAKAAGDVGQLGHVLFVAAWVAGYEVGYDLLVEVLLTAYTVEQPLEFVELLEGGLSHQLEHTVAGVLRSHLQTAADMTCDEFAGVFLSGTVDSLVLASV